MQYSEANNNTERCLILDLIFDFYFKSGKN